MDTPKVTVIIITYNGEEFIKNCLKSLEEQDYQKDAYNLIVVDNNSQDNTLKILKTFPKIAIIQNKKNLGFGRANNIALRKCLEKKYSILLNQDSIVEKDFIMQLVSVMEHNSTIGVCGGAEHPYDKTLKSTRKTEETNWIGAGATSFRMKALQEVGFFDPNYFMYSEDIDICARLRCAGWKVYYHPKAIWHHYGWKRQVTVNSFRLTTSTVSRIYLLIKLGSIKQIKRTLKKYLIKKKNLKVLKIEKKENISIKKNLIAFKIIFSLLPKIPFALIQRWKIRRLAYFNQQLVDKLIQENDAQIFV